MTTQITRTPTTTWSTVFPTEQNSLSQSTIFVKKLLAVGLSSITYLRTLFPEEAYTDRNLDGLKLKMLQDNSDCYGANTLVSWIKSAFHAMDKQYLRQLTLTLHTNPKEHDKAIESYTYKISYTKDNEAIISELVTRIDSVEKKHDVRRSTQKMLRTVLLLTQSLKPLPSKIFLTMKLTYYDEVTPPEYEPVGFKPAIPSSSHSLGDPITIKVGDISTPFHTVKLRVTVNKAMYSDDNEEENVQKRKIITEDGENPQPGDEKAESTELDNAEDPLPSGDPTIGRSIKRSKKPFAALIPECHTPQASLSPKDDQAPSSCFGQDKQDSTNASPQLGPPQNTPLEDCVPSITPVSKSCTVMQVVSAGSSKGVQVVPEVKPQESQDKPFSVRRSRRLLSLSANVTPATSASGMSESSTMRDDHEEHVRCECGVHYDDGLMILCDICKFWQHALCFKLTKKEEVPEQHICLQCSVTSGLPCTDSSFKDMPKRQVQQICLLRRALEFLRSYPSWVTATKLGQRLGLDISKVQKVWTHLKSMLVFEDRGRKKHQRVNKTCVEAAYSKYFDSQTVHMDGQQFEDNQIMQTPKQADHEEDWDSDMTPDLNLPVQVFDSEMESTHDTPVPDSEATQVVTDTDSQMTTQNFKESQGEGLPYTQQGEVADSTQDVPVGTQKIITLGTGLDGTYSNYSSAVVSQTFATAGNTLATLGEEIEETPNICSNPVESADTANADTVMFEATDHNEPSLAKTHVIEPTNISQEHTTENPEKSTALVFESADINELPRADNLQENQLQMNTEGSLGPACGSVELHIQNPGSRRALMTRSSKLSRNKGKQPVTMNLNDFEISSSQGSPTPEKQQRGKRAKIL